MDEFRVATGAGVLAVQGKTTGSPDRGHVRIQHEVYIDLRAVSGTAAA